MPCPCCDPCRGSCSTAADCAEGCRCVDGECVPPCSGACSTSADCAVGCECVGGECGSPQGTLCCCDGGVVTGATEGCVNTTPGFPDATPADISVVVDWDGLTAVIDEPYITPSHIYYSKGVQEGTDFSCFISEGEESLDVTVRTMQCNFELFGVGGGCLYITGNVNLFFLGTFASTGFVAGQQADTLSPSPSVCQTTVESAITGSPPFWCPNPHGSFITTELIIAP